jgi:hypothetical protein
MADRISSIHLKQFIAKLIDDESVRDEVLALVERHVDTVRADKNDLTNGIQQLLSTPNEGRRNAEALLERFGKMPSLIFSDTKNG